ncbi:cytochrome c oxidase biogenesis protein cmc1 like domain-containing protein [Ditylenchus destructor]|nr:cytochrome c oxidase biogenesis protein cmc1 like domain-containing protein [Ditylenchus destructor]
MFADWSRQSHTDECNFLIDLWKECMETHRIRRMFGYCNYWYIALNQCAHEERIIKRELIRKHKGHYTGIITRLPVDRYTPALKKLKEAGLLNLDSDIQEGCNI